MNTLKKTNLYLNLVIIIYLKRNRCLNNNRQIMKQIESKYDLQKYSYCLINQRITLKLKHFRTILNFINLQNLNNISTFYLSLWKYSSFIFIKTILIFIIFQMYLGKYFVYFSQNKLLLSVLSIWTIIYVVSHTYLLYTLIKHYISKKFERFRFPWREFYKSNFRFHSFRNFRNS